MLKLTWSDTLQVSDHYCLSVTSKQIEVYETFLPGKQQWCITLRSVAWKRRKFHVINVRTKSKFFIISMSISNCMTFRRDAKFIFPLGIICKTQDKETWEYFEFAISRAPIWHGLSDNFFPSTDSGQNSSLITSCLAPRARKAPPFRALEASQHVIGLTKQLTHHPPTHPSGQDLKYLCAIKIWPIFHFCHCALYAISCYVEQCYHAP